MKSFLVICLLASTQAFAAPFKNHLSLDCVPAQPCQYATKGLKHCISRVNLTGRVDGTATEIISLRPVKMSREVYLRPQTHEVSVTRGENQALSFQSDDGDQWGELQPIPGGRYSGVISVDQDFEFKVTCIDKAIGFE